MASASKVDHWYAITAVDVMAEATSRAIVVLGDSITDGRGSTTNGNDRWPDALAVRLRDFAPTAGVSLANSGIGGNAVTRGGLGATFNSKWTFFGFPDWFLTADVNDCVHTSGPTGISRFQRDVLNQSNVAWVIIFEGVNDIGGGAQAKDIIADYADMVAQARAAKLKVFGATITPFGGNGYYSPEREAVRAAVNAYIRKKGMFDDVIDFDLAVRDSSTPPKLQPQFDSGDGLHLNPDGYAEMADEVDISNFA